MNRSWIVIASLIAVVAATTIWFVFQQAKSPGKLATLPEKTPLEAVADQIEIAIKGQGAKVVRLVHTDDGWVVYGETTANSVELEKLLKQIADLYKEIDRTKVSVAEAGFLSRTDALKDAYGNKLKELPIAEVKLSGETFSMINWDGFDPKNFERVADHYWIHEEIMNLSMEKQQQSDGGGGAEAGGQQGTGGSQSSTASGE